MANSIKDNNIRLFNTKTKCSDMEAPLKHNALIAYFEEDRKLNPAAKFIGGVIIPEPTGNTVSSRYCRNRIADTNDLTG